MEHRLQLASGSVYLLKKIRNDLIRNYYLLAFPKDQGQPSPEEVTEMLNLGISHAQALASEQLGTPRHTQFCIAATATISQDVKRLGTFTSYCWEIVGRKRGYILSWRAKIFFRHSDFGETMRPEAYEH